MNIEELFDFVKSAVDAGVQAYIRSTEPTSDVVNQADAKKYIKSLGYKPAMLGSWVNAGLLHKNKSGTAQNAQVWYSKAEIKNLLATIRLKTICNDEILETYIQ